MATEAEFKHYLHQWSQKQYRALQVGYLAVHGEPGVLRIGQKKYSFDHLGEVLSGKLAGRIL